MSKTVFQGMIGFDTIDGNYHVTLEQEDGYKIDLTSGYCGDVPGKWRGGSRKGAASLLGSNVKFWGQCRMYVSPCYI